MSTPSNRTWPDGRSVESGDGAAERRLAAAALAHEAQRLAPLDRQGDAVDGMDDLVAGAEERVDCWIGKWTLRSRTSTTGGRAGRLHGRADRRRRARGRRLHGRAHRVALRRDPGASRRPDGRRPAGVSSGVSVHASIGGELAARRERAAGRRPDQVRRLAGDALEHAGRDLVDARHAAQQARACTGGAGRRTAASRGAISTIRPPYITATRSHTPATMPRLWVMRIVAVFISRLSVGDELQDLRLDGRVERGRRLVGDAAAPGGRRWRARSSRAGACRPTAGGDRRRTAARGSGMPTSSEQLDGPVAGGPAAACPRWTPSSSVTCWPTVISGLSEAAGSWGMRPM